MTGSSHFKATKKISHKKAHKAQKEFSSARSVPFLLSSTFFCSLLFCALCAFLWLIFFVPFVALVLMVAHFQKKLFVACEVLIG